MIDGLYGLCVSSSIRQKAALCASLPGAMGPGSLRCPNPGGTVGCLDRRIIEHPHNLLCSSPNSTRPFADC